MKFKKRTRQIISMFVFLSLILTLAVSNSTIVFAANDTGISYGCVYYDEDFQLRVITGDAAQEKIDEIQNIDESSGTGIGISGFSGFSIAQAPQLDWMVDRTDIAAAQVYNVNTAAEFVLQNALAGNYGSQATPLAEITLPKALSKGQLSSLYNCVYTYFPHYFSLGYSYVANAASKEYKYGFWLSFVDGDNVDAERTRAQELAIQLAGNLTEEDKIADAVNDWLIENCTYDHEAATNNLYRGQHAFNAMLAIDATAVCAGYANAFALICQYAGLNVVGISGNAGGPHRWNWVLSEDDKAKYLVDVTWNDGTVNGVEVNNTTNSKYFWQTDLTTKTYNDNKARTWDKAQDSFIAYINKADDVDVKICNGVDTLNDDPTDELVLYVGGGKFTTPLGGVVTTNSVQLAAYEEFDGELHDYARSKNRTWAVTKGKDIRPTLNGKNYETDRTVVNVAGGKVTAVAPDTVYLWYIYRDASGIWFDSMADPIKVTVKVAPTAMFLSTNYTYNADTGVTSGVDKPVTKATLSYGASPISLYLNAFNKKGKIITLPDDSVKYTLKFAKPSDAEYLTIAGVGCSYSKEEDAYVFGSDVIKSGKAIQIGVAKKPAKNTNVVLIVTCNKNNRTARFTVTIPKE